MPHAALCVLGQYFTPALLMSGKSFNAARSIVCVGTMLTKFVIRLECMFQCRTQHCVCRDSKWRRLGRLFSSCFNAARSIVCVGTLMVVQMSLALFVSMPHAALCVLGHQWVWAVSCFLFVSMPHAALCVLGHQWVLAVSCFLFVSMPHAALCVLGLCRPQPLSRAG